MPRLDEGMREGDLANLVLPMLSVDEYASKIDDEQAIVIGFYVQDEQAAKDLNRFLQKSAIPLLGTDVSPAPDQHGFFMVFAELMRNARLTQNIADILAELEPLVDVENWQLHVRGQSGVLPFSDKNLSRCLSALKQQQKAEKVMEYFHPSALSNVEIDGELLILEGSGERFCFEFVDFDRTQKIITEHDLGNSGISLSLHSLARANRIRRMLGENWEASIVNGYVLLQSAGDPRALLLAQ